MEYEGNFVNGYQQGDGKLYLTDSESKKRLIYDG